MLQQPRIKSRRRARGREGAQGLIPLIPRANNPFPSPRDSHLPSRQHADHNHRLRWPTNIGQQRFPSHFVYTLACARVDRAFLFAFFGSSSHMYIHSGIVRFIPCDLNSMMSQSPRPASTAVSNLACPYACPSSPPTLPTCIRLIALNLPLHFSRPRCRRSPLVIYSSTSLPRNLPA